MAIDPTHTDFGYHVQASWDPEAAVWYVSETDVPGLATEAETLEQLSEKLRVMIPELLAANGPRRSVSSTISFELIGHRQECIRLAS